MQSNFLKVSWIEKKHYWYIVFFIGAWVAVLTAIIFFLIGFCWYYGQTVLRRYIHVHAQTTALTQLAHRFGSTDKLISSTDENEQLTRSRSFPIEHEAASSDEEDERKTDPAIHTLPPIADEDGPLHKRISFVNNFDETTFPESSSGNVICTITPGLGVFLTTSSRHTPHVFERVLANIHAVGWSIRNSFLFCFL